MHSRYLGAAVIAAIAALGYPGAASALGDDPIIGSIELVGFDYCPVNTVEPRGEELRISDYQLLYSIIGNRYGGDAQKGTFKLPALGDYASGGWQSKAPMPGMRYCLVIDGIYPQHP